MRSSWLQLVMLNLFHHLVRFRNKFWMIMTNEHGVPLTACAVSYKKKGTFKVPFQLPGLLRISINSLHSYYQKMICMFHYDKRQDYIQFLHWQQNNQNLLLYNFYNNHLQGMSVKYRNKCQCKFWLHKYHFHISDYLHNPHNIQIQKYKNHYNLYSLFGKQLFCIRYLNEYSLLFVLYRGSKLYQQGKKLKYNQYK